MGKIPSVDDIPIGRDNALSRQALCDLWGLSDRRVRDTISHMRNDDDGTGYVIVSYSSGKGGYYRTDDLEEITHFRNELTKRARNTFRPLKKIRRIMSEVKHE